MMCRSPCPLHATEVLDNRGLRISDGFDRINIGPQIVTRNTRRRFCLKYPLRSRRLVGVQPLPDGALGDFNDPRERRLSTCSLNCFRQRLGWGEGINHAL
jgi:hypothetical protein